MQNQCGCDHHCKCRDVWKCILKPFWYLFWGYIILSVGGEVMKHPEELVIPGAVVLFIALLYVVAVVCECLFPPKQDAHSAPVTKQ
ncbi:MAG TPA: hypothetical protein VJ553_03010 [Candidatus Paceibacterota bacterium]|nr:hypothetical protein [Candidatus Paceibacterota bacterium]